MAMNSRFLVTSSTPMQEKSEEISMEFPISTNVISDHPSRQTVVAELYQPAMRNLLHSDSIVE